jgi:hypothetical protein
VCPRKRPCYQSRVDILGCFALLTRFEFTRHRSGKGVSKSTEESAIAEASVRGCLTSKASSPAVRANINIQIKNALASGTAVGLIIHNVSATNPDEELEILLRAPLASKTCSNIGTWPVLVGKKEKGEAVAMLSSPIILYDYPEIAQESPGEFFDGTEIDEILTLRVLTMTDQEKWEMSQGDEHARRILLRTEELPEEAFWQMHGTIRDRQTSSEEFFDPNTRLEHVTVNGTDLKIGHRVQIRPPGRADVMDLALEGKIA